MTVTVAAAYSLEEEGELSPIAKKMWGHLRRGLLHYLRHTVVDDNPTGPGSSFSKEARKAAADEVLAFAKLAEEVGWVCVTQRSMHSNR